MKSRKSRDGQYYVLKTLLDGDPDCNRRSIYRWPEERVILVMNPNMNPWTEEDENLLDFILKALNWKTLYAEDA